jgi:hypothetical protein
LALDGLRPDAVKWEAVSYQPSALSVSHKPSLFTAKVAKDAKKEENSVFLVPLYVLCVRCGKALADG